MPYEKDVQLYSKGSASHVEILKRLVDAKARAGSENAHLVLESDSFGRVRIRSFKSHYYICINGKGNIVGLSKKKGRKFKRCVYQEMHTKDMFTQFRSIKYRQWYLGFTKTGDPKSAKKSKIGNRATKFIKRNWTLRVKRQHAKRNIKKSREKKITCRVLWRKRRLREKERKRLSLPSTFCLTKQRRHGQGRSAGVTSGCTSFLHRQNRCR